MVDYNTKAKSSGGDFEKTPVGNMQAICLGVYGLGFQKVEYKGVAKILEQTRLIWQLSKKDKNGDNFFIGKTYTLSLGDKATLRKHLESWRGKRFTIEELAGFETKNVEGKNCMLSIVESENGGRYIDSISGLPEGMPEISKQSEIPEGMIKKIEEIRGNAVPMEDAPAPSESEQVGDSVPF